MGRGKTVPLAIRKIIIQRFEEGEKQVDIARSFRLNKSIVCRIIKKFKETGQATAITNSGRTRKTSRRVDKRIIRMSKNNPFLSSTQIKADLEETGLANISARTVRRRLVDGGLFGRRPAKKPLLSKKNVKARLKFAQAHIHWTTDQWKKVVFSDESKFNLFKSDGPSYVRRPVGSRLNKKYIIPTVKHGGGSIMVWGCFSAFGVGPLHRIEGHMDRFMYRDILENHLLPYLDETMPLRHVFQHDNDPKHKSKVVTDWLKNQNINVLPWPSQSPDLNPIENMWDQVDHKIRHKTYRNVNELLAALREAWRTMDMSYIQKLIESMPRRCAEVIKQKGYYTKY